MNPFLMIFCIGVVLSLLHLFLSKKPKTSLRIIHLILIYQLVFSVGINSLLGFYAHAFLSDQTAAYIGWPPGNPFQLEVAFTNLTFGILGILCIWIRGNFWIATILGISIWYLADAYGHIRDMLVNHNYAPGNAGAPLYTDICLPIFLIILMIIHQVLNSKHQSKIDLYINKQN